MAIEFSLGQRGTTWRVKLTDCITELPFDISDVASQSIVFYDPNGNSFSKAGTLEEDLPDNPGTYYIVYHNTDPEESILTILDEWEYAGAAVLTTTDNLQTSEREVFWVV